jgi:hypothetical protein
MAARQSASHETLNRSPEEIEAGEHIFYLDISTFDDDKKKFITNPLPVTGEINLIEDFVTVHKIKRYIKWTDNSQIMFEITNLEGEPLFERNVNINEWTKGLINLPKIYGYHKYNNKFVLYFYNQSGYEKFSNFLDTLIFDVSK